MVLPGLLSKKNRIILTRDVILIEESDDHLMVNEIHTFQILRIVPFTQIEMLHVKRIKRKNQEIIIKSSRRKRNSPFDNSDKNQQEFNKRYRRRLVNQKGEPAGRVEK